MHWQRHLLLPRTTSRDGFVGWHLLDEVLRELVAYERSAVYPNFKVRRLVE